MLALLYQVTLSTKAAPFAAPCSALLTTATIAKIGADAQCSVGGGLAAADTLIITLLVSCWFDWSVAQQWLPSQQVL